MILVIGGAFSGRHRLVASGKWRVESGEHTSGVSTLRQSSVTAGSTTERKDESGEYTTGKVSTYDVTKDDALDFGKEISGTLKDFSFSEQACLSKTVEKISSYNFVVATEMGCGVVPISEEDRDFREANGRLNQALAKVAEKVLFVVAGRTVELKDVLRQAQQPRDTGSATNRNLVVFRHGETLSNVEKRFAGGLSDVPLTEKGISQAQAAHEKLCENFSGYSENVGKEIISPKKVFVSPMKRAVQTARILFPKAELVLVDGLREIKTGLLENMTHEELSSGLFCDGTSSAENAALYQKWLDSNGVEAPPSSEKFHGESAEMFTCRVRDAFQKVLEENCGTENFVVVAHGGVQMALCNEFFSKAKMNGIDYFKWQSENVGFRFGKIL